MLTSSETHRLDSTIRLQHRCRSRKVVTALFERRMATPGDPISREELMAQVWSNAPGCSGRLRVTMRHLRRVGLDEVLLQLRGGYLLNPTIPIEIVASGPRRPR